MRGTIGKHLQRAFINDVHRQLMTTRAQAHRPIEDRSKVLFTAAVYHRARRVIHRPEKHSRERYRDVVFRVRVFAPLVLFEPPDTLSAD